MEPATEETIIVRREGNVGIVQVKRHERKNALTREMLELLVLRLKEFRADAATKEAMNQALVPNFEVLRRQVDNAQFVLARSDDHQEAMAAFAERRAPRYIRR